MYVFMVLEMYLNHFLLSNSYERLSLDLPLSSFTNRQFQYMYRKRIDCVCGSAMECRDMAMAIFISYVLTFFDWGDAGHFDLVQHLKASYFCSQ